MFKDAVPNVLADDISPVLPIFASQKCLNINKRYNTEQLMLFFIHDVTVL
jgi:hypothetical protein